MNEVEQSKMARMENLSLLKLAKSLGIVETFYCKGEGPAKGDAKTVTIPEQQYYEYLIVIDFEATCWEKSDVKWRQPEIIEFPAILLNLKTGKIVSEFRQYILPTESTKLSAFCTKLTGIKQTTIDKDGIPLQTCLMLFDNWQKDMIKLHNLVLPKTSRKSLQGNCAFATWSDWDLGLCLAGECERKRLKKHSYFDQWIDVRSIYKKWYKYNPKNFSDALQHIGMSFVGREHSGIDDSRNISALSHTMAKEGAQFLITKDLKPYLVFNQI